MSSVAGINRIDLCDKGSLSSGSPQNGASIGLAGTMEFSSDPTNQIKSYLEQEVRNKQKFPAKSESFQATMNFLELLMKWSGYNFDGQIVTSKQDSGKPNVFKIEGSNFFGLEFDYEVSPKKRSATVTLERTFDLPDAISFIDEARSNTEISIPGVKGKRGIDYSLVRMPWFLAFQLEGGNYVQLQDLVNWVFKIKTVGEKSEVTGVIDVSYFLFELEVTAKSASMGDIVQDLRRYPAPAVKIRFRNKGDYYDEFDFAPDVLALNSKFKIDSKSRTKTIVLKGQIDRYDYTVEYGSGKGGAENDKNAIKGGTMKIGY